MFSGVATTTYVFLYLVTLTIFVGEKRAIWYRERVGEQERRAQPAAVGATNPIVTLAVAKGKKTFFLEKHP